MPFEFEPCGLNHRFTVWAYGTLPIVRSVGGLKDSVNDYDEEPEVATGFKLKEPTRKLCWPCYRSLLLPHAQNPSEIKRVQLYAMQQDFLAGKMQQRVFNDVSPAISSRLFRFAGTNIKMVKNLIKLRRSDKCLCYLVWSTSQV